MIERSICYFKARGERRGTKGDKRGRPSTTMWRDWKKRTEVRRLTSFERFICEREKQSMIDIQYTQSYLVTFKVFKPWIISSKISSLNTTTLEWNKHKHNKLVFHLKTNYMNYLLLAFSRSLGNLKQFSGNS